MKETEPITPAGRPVAIETISAVTLPTHDMARATAFYEALGFTVAHGGANAPFTSLAMQSGHINLAARNPDAQTANWVRVIIHVSDVDAMYERVLARGLKPESPPHDAPWGERFFHICDPDGHTLSFARPLPSAHPGE